MEPQTLPMPGKWYPCGAEPALHHPPQRCFPTAVHSPHETLLSLALGSEHREGETCFYTDRLWQITCGKRKTGEFLFLLGAGHCPWGLLLAQDTLCQGITPEPLEISLFRLEPVWFQST